MPIDVIAERALDYWDGETTKPITVRVFRPEEQDGRWECAVELVGLLDDRLSAYGADSAQALMHALDAVGTEVRKHKLSASAGHPWPVRLEPIELVEAPKPPPLEPGVIAEVEVERFADEEGPAGKGRVTLCAPVPAGERRWECEYRITGIKDDRRRVSKGVGSFDALLGAIFQISSQFWHEPAFVDEGHPAREHFRRYEYEPVPFPLLLRRLRKYGATTPWLVDLDAGIQALRQFHRWVEVTKETAEVVGGVAALERSLRYLQTAQGQVDFPKVQDWDISRVVEIRKAVDAGLVTPAPGLGKLVYDAIVSWYHMVHEIMNQSESAPSKAT